MPVAVFIHSLGKILSQQGMNKFLMGLKYQIMFSSHIQKHNIAVEVVELYYFAKWYSVVLNFQLQVKNCLIESFTVLVPMLPE